LLIGEETNIGDEIETFWIGDVRIGSM